MRRIVHPPPATGPQMYFRRRRQRKRISSDCKHICDAWLGSSAPPACRAGGLLCAFVQRASVVHHSLADTHDPRPLDCPRLPRDTGLRDLALYEGELLTTDPLADPLLALEFELPQPADEAESVHRPVLLDEALGHFGLFDLHGKCIFAQRAGHVEDAARSAEGRRPASAVRRPSNQPHLAVPRVKGSGRLLALPTALDPLRPPGADRACDAVGFRRMGTWGVAIFSNDTAADVRGAFRELIEDGRSDEDATAEVLRRFHESLTDRDDAPFFWTGLAATQYRLGRLQPMVRDRAIAFI